MASRRALLAGIAALAAPRLARAEAERWIWTQNSAREELAIAYRAGEAYDEFAMARLRRHLRDLRAGEQGPLPPLLIDMLSVLQERWGYSRPLLIHSGYRTRATNAATEGAAPASLHLSGQAVDIEVPGMPMDDLAMQVWSLSRRLGFLGLGVYPRFVHVDIGPQRVWNRWAARRG
jgi:uncharacterized protein YcbK (DUF882 family)